MGAKALELPRGKFRAFFFIFEDLPSCKNEKKYDLFVIVNT